MLEKIKKALSELNIERWRINEVKEESAELFFVKHALDTRRIKDTHKCTVTVYRQGEKDKKKLVGNMSAQVISSMSYDEIKSAIESAYYAAQFAMNPYFDAPEKVTSDTIVKQGELASAPLAESAGKMAAAVFKADTNEHAYVNSTEVFCHRTYTRILSSEGTDVSFTDAVCKGDYVVQCKSPEDVELINQFEYDDVCADALTQGVKEYLDFVYDRACAQRVLKSGKYNVILSGQNLAEVLSYYNEKSAADMIYPGYSTWKIGDGVQGKCDIVYGDVSSMPFDDEAFDCVSAFETVYFWEDLEKCFAEVRRVMKSGGTVLICNESDGTNPKDEKWAKKIGGMKIYNEMQLRTMLEKVGFCDIKSFADAKKHWLCIVANK